MSTVPDFPRLVPALLCALLLSGAVLAATTVVGPARAQSISAEDDLWDVVRDSADPAILRKFLDRFPKGRHAADAREKLEILGQDDPSFAPAVDPAAIVNARRKLATVNDCDLYAADPMDIANPIGLVALEDLDPKQAVPACRLALANRPDDPRYQYLLARALEGKRDLKGWDEAMPLLDAAVASNYAAAMRALGYMTVILAPLDHLEEAIATWASLLTRAGDLGDPFALILRVTGEYELYASMVMAPGPDRDAVVARAVDMLHALSDVGMGSASVMLAEMTASKGLVDGLIPADAKSSCDYYERGMVAGSMRALGIMWNIAPGHTCAFKGDDWMRHWHHVYMQERSHLAEGGNTKAMLNMYFTLRTNQSGDMDYPLAVSWLERAAKFGDVSAAYWLGFDVLLSGPAVFIDQRRAGTLFADLIEQGDTGAYMFFKDVRPSYRGKPPDEMPDFIRALQQRLREGGFYRGAIDGDVGPGTMAAIEASYGNWPAPEDNL